MSQSREWKKFKLDTPATYRIRVQGDIDPAWSDMLLLLYGSGNDKFEWDATLHGPILGLVIEF